MRLRLHASVYVVALMLTFLAVLGVPARSPAIAAPPSPPSLHSHEGAPLGSWHVTLRGPSVFELYAAGVGAMVDGGVPGALLSPAGGHALVDQNLLTWVGQSRVGGVRTTTHVTRGDAVVTRERATVLARELAEFERVVQSRQRGAVAAIEAQGARVISQYTTAANGLLVHAPANVVARIAVLPWVTRVESAPLVRPLLRQSVPHIGTNALAEATGYDGTGSYVAVIDTGVDYTHAHLGGPGTVEAFQAAASARETITDTWEGELLYPNEKVVGGWDFVGRRYNPPHICSDAQMATGSCTNIPEPDPDPLDGGSHGTHVSGIVAGEAVAQLGDGVAPGARLVALKLYGLGGGDEAADVLVDAIEWCVRVNLGLEDRGILPPHIDAINISLGEGQAIASQLYDTAAEAAEGVGIVIAAAAGNSGDRPFVLGSPSSSPSILSVASSLPPVSRLEVELRWAGEEGAEQIEALLAIESSIAVPLARLDDGILEADVGWFGRGCDEDAPEQDVEERIALVARGTCTFTEKILNVQSAGGVGVLMFTDGGPKTAMAGDGSAIQIPAVMIDNRPGIELQERLESGVSVTARFDAAKLTIDPSTADFISGFSSRGPGRNGPLKPDITGPGSDILSTARGTGMRGSSFSGTSMSSPHLGGAAAIIAQRNREEELGLGARELKALLMNTARPVIRGGGNADSVPRQGAGRVDLMAAGLSDLIITAGAIASLDFGAFSATSQGQRDLPLVAQNIGANDLRLSFDTAVPQAEDASSSGVHFAPPASEVVVPAGGSATITATLTFDPLRMRPWTLLGPAGAVANDVRRLEVDGFLMVDAVSDAEDAIAAPQLSVPFYALPRPASNIHSPGLPAWDHRRMQDEHAAEDAPYTSEITFYNGAPITGTVEIFLAPFLGDDLPAPDDPNEPEVPLELDVRAVGVRIEGGSNDADGGRLTFGVALHEVAAIPQQGRTEIYIDTDRDGVPDYRIREVPDGDRMETRVARWIAATDTITGAESTTDTLHVTDLHTRLTMLSVPLWAIDMTAPEPFHFSVIRRGAHVDWWHLGVADSLPDEAAEADTTWPHYRVPFDRFQRLPAAWTITVPGGGNASVALRDTGGDTDLDPELLVFYPSNRFELDDGRGAQLQRLVPGDLPPPAIYLPLSLHDLSDGAQ